MPIYAFFANAFFPKYAAPVMISMYFIGILMAILIALIGKNTVFKGEAVPFVMELPNYRMPGAKSVLQLMWDKAKDFLQRAFSVIFIGTIVVWFLQNFNFSMNMVSDPQSSMLAALAGFLAPLFIPLGFGNWQMVTALISGFLAKESVVSMMAVVYGGTAAVRSAITPLAAFTFMVFCLLYTPCIAAVATIRKEQGRGAAILMVIFQCVVAWLVAWAVYLIGSIIL